MRRLQTAPLLIFFLLPGLCVGAITVRDDTGARVTLERPAGRIVSLAPHATELLFAAGAGEHVVGTVAFSDFPQAAQGIPRVGGYERLDIERIVAARPDLIVGWGSGNSAEQIERLRRLGFPLFISEPNTLDAIAQTMERLGRLAGTEEQAARAAQRFRERLAALRRRYAERRPVRVFYQVWHRPLITVNGEQLISRVIALCGGTNVFSELPVLAPQVDREAVLAADPDVILASGDGEQRPEGLDLWRRWPQLQAVQSGALFAVPAEWIQRFTPRILNGVERVCGQLEEARKRRRAHEE